jgi:general secretion pathway protein J
MSAMIPPNRTQQTGFTLVEMLVALAIFAMLSAAGVMLLRASIDTQVAVSARLGESGGINRLRAMLTRELATAQPRVSRDENGTLRAAFVGSGSGIAFVHGSGGDAGRPALGRVSYMLDDGALVRRASARIDGGLDGELAPILHDVTALHWRYRARDGGWIETWAADDAARLPRAVELTVARRGGPPLTMRFLVAPDGLAPEGQTGGLT